MCFKPGFEAYQSESRKTLGNQKVILGACRKTLNDVSACERLASKYLCSVDEVTLFSEYNNFKSG